MSRIHDLRIKLLNRFARTRAGKLILGRIGRSLNDKQWVFVIGCYNSGTTLLQRLMQAHPDIATMPAEGVAFTDVIVRPEKYGWTRMWWKCVDQIRHDSDYSEHGARRLRSQWSWLVDKPSAPCVLEKSIVNVVHAPFYEKYFNKPKFIHLVRNGYAVSEGIRRKASPAKWNNTEYKQAYPISLCARQWVETLEAVYTLKNQGGQVLEVKYEDLTRDPDSVLAEIFKYLELPMLVEEVGEKKWLVHGNVDAIKNLNNKSIEALSSNDKQEIQEIGSTWLSYYKYSNNSE